MAPTEDQHWLLMEPVLMLSWGQFVAFKLYFCYLVYSYFEFLFAKYRLIHLYAR